MATYNRGRHIVPSIQSVVSQSFPDYELLVIGDHCTDDSEHFVRDFSDDRIVWHNLPRRGGSQSYPNNAGIARARGNHIAYLGHDDIWAIDHLESLHRAIEANPGTDFAISGCALHDPPGVHRVRVAGIFDADSAKHRHFFPPSCISHRIEVTNIVGPWADPMSVDRQVDVDLQCRAVEAGMKFVSTGKITVHKFPASDRYLSYLVQDSQEQCSMLARTKASDYVDYLEDLISLAQGCGLYMKENLIREAKWTGQEASNRKNRKKGILLPKLKELNGPLLMEPPEGPFGSDWRYSPTLRLLLSKANPNPRLLISVTGRSPAECALVLAHKDKDQVSSLQISGPLITPSSRQQTGQNSKSLAGRRQLSYEPPERLPYCSAILLKSVSSRASGRTGNRDRQRRAGAIGQQSIRGPGFIAAPRIQRSDRPARIAGTKARMDVKGLADRGPRICKGPRMKAGIARPWQPLPDHRVKFLACFNGYRGILMAPCWFENKECAISRGRMLKGRPGLFV